MTEARRSGSKKRDRKMAVAHHVNELRRAFVFCVASVLFFSVIGYVFFDTLLKLFQKPLNQPLYYTSPTGGFTFVIKLCLVVGVISSVPLIVNRLFGFVKPAVPTRWHRSFAWYSLFSIILAFTGVVFGYLVSLPAALHFLIGFDNEQIKPLISADSYFTFFSTYLIGYAILFQTPILMLFINRVRPLKPGDTMRYQRHVIGGSFVVAAFLTPTPDPWNQTLMAVPVILLYQFGIILVWWVNKQTMPEWEYLERDSIKAKVPRHLQQPTPVANRQTVHRVKVPAEKSRVKVANTQKRQVVDIIHKETPVSTSNR